MCPVHSFSFDGSKFYDQAYCQSATAPGTGVEPQQELCTATKSYNNDTVVDNVVNGVVKSISVTPITNPADGKPGTQIVETWVGDIDTFWH
jgi:hypothetical protein